jgi:hypothetical protein
MTNGILVVASRPYAGMYTSNSESQLGGQASILREGAGHWYCNISRDTDLRLWPSGTRGDAVAPPAPEATLPKPVLRLGDTWLARSRTPVALLLKQNLVGRCCVAALISGAGECPPARIWGGDAAPPYRFECWRKSQGGARVLALPWPGMDAGLWPSERNPSFVSRVSPGTARMTARQGATAFQKRSKRRRNNPNRSRVHLPF